MKYLLFTLTLLAVTFNVKAQSHDHGHDHANHNHSHGSHGHEKADKFTNRLDSIVGLNAEQKGRVNQLAIQKTNDIKAIKAKYKTADGQKTPENKKAEKAEVKVVKAKFQQDLKSILTPEQQTKYESYKAKKKEEKAKKGQSKNGSKKKDKTVDDSEEDDDSVE